MVAKPVLGFVVTGIVGGGEVVRHECVGLGREAMEVLLLGLLEEEVEGPMLYHLLGKLFGCWSSLGSKVSEDRFGAPSTHKGYVGGIHACAE